MSETNCPACAESRAEIERLTAELAKETRLKRLWENGVDGAHSLNEIYREKLDHAQSSFYHVTGMSVAEWEAKRKRGEE